MKLIAIKLFILGVIGFHSISMQAQEIVSPETLTGTENAVFMPDGRYFVAGKAGIHEVKSTPDYRNGCVQDASTGYYVCEIVSNQFEGDTCFFSGMTTDDTYLYATCTIAASDSLLDQIKPPKRAVLFRVLPGESKAADVKTTDFQDPTWYNGMAMLDDNTLLMTPSNFLGMDSAIVKMHIYDQENLQFTVEEWMSGSIFYLLNNGIRVDNGFVYLVGGQNLLRIRIRWDGTPSVPVLLYQAPVNKVLDDFTIVGDWLAVSEVGLINGLGLNSITFVHKLGTFLPYKKLTGLTQLSSLEVDPGTFFEAGSLIGTSFFQGGVYQYE